MKRLALTLAALAGLTMLTGTANAAGYHFAYRRPMVVGYSHVAKRMELRRRAANRQLALGKVHTRPLTAWERQRLQERVSEGVVNDYIRRRSVSGTLTPSGVFYHNYRGRLGYTSGGVTIWLHP